MNKHVNTILYQVAANTLEQVTFLFVEKPENEEILERINEMVTAVVAFRGPFSGYIWFSTDFKLLPELASNMLGNEEEKTTVKEQMDAFKEVTNILCGNLLPKIAGPEKVFDIETPMILEPVIESDSEQWELIGEIIFTIDETDAKLQLFIESPVPNELLKL